MRSQRRRVALGVAVFAILAASIYIMLRSEDSARPLDTRSAVAETRDEVIGSADESTTNSSASDAARSNGAVSTDEQEHSSAINSNGFDVVGEVVGLSGKPITGAHVAVDPQATPSEGIEAMYRRGVDADASRLTAVSGEDGRFTVRGATAGRAVVTVRAAGHATHRERDRRIVRERPNLGRIVLYPAETLRGRVMRPGGVGIAGARVAEGSISEFMADSRGAFRNAVVTDDDGNFEMRDVRKGELALLVDARDGAIHTRGIDTTISKWIPIVLT